MTENRNPDFIDHALYREVAWETFANTLANGFRERNLGKQVGREMLGWLNDTTGLTEKDRKFWLTVCWWFT